MHMNNTPVFAFTGNQNASQSVSLDRNAWLDAWLENQIARARAAGEAAYREGRTDQARTYFREMACLIAARSEQKVAELEIELGLQAA